MYVVVDSRKDRSKVLKEHILREIVPRGFDARIEEMQEQHCQAIAGHDNQIQAVQHENVALQALRDVYQAQLQRCQDQIRDLIINCHVPHLRDPSRDNIIIIVRKHTTSANKKYHDLPYYVARIQQRKRYVKLSWFDRHFPGHQVIVETIQIVFMHLIGLKRNSM